MSSNSNKASLFIKSALQIGIKQKLYFVYPYIYIYIYIYPYIQVGGVIMKTKHCLKMVKELFDDTTTSKNINLKCVSKVVKGLGAITEKCKNNLANKEKEYLMNFISL